MMEEVPIGFVVTGHVDHGKSTFIGRLLYDTKSVTSDKIKEIIKVSEDPGWGAAFAHLLDHLEEERLEGITIDTTQRFLTIGKRNYVIIDSPGHVEFTKNMMTGASQADAAVLIIDAQEKMKEQTRRHAHLLHLLGIDQLIVLVNKMDLAGHKEEAYRHVKTEAEKFMSAVGAKPLVYIPVSALKGENVVTRCEKMDWYKGPTFAESLGLLKARRLPMLEPLIFPVQDVYRRGGQAIAVGRVEAGEISEGDEVKILPAGKIDSIGSVVKYPDKVKRARTGESIGITLKKRTAVKRGNVICKPGAGPVSTDRFCASVFWISQKDLDIRRKVKIRCSTQEVAGRIVRIKRKIDSSSLGEIDRRDKILRHFEVGEVYIRTERPVVVTSVNSLPELGRFVITIGDEVSAAGIIRGIE